MEKEPEFRDKSPEIYIRPNTDEPITFTGDSLRVIFFGVAFYSDKYKKLVADKVFMTNAESLSL